MPNTPARKRKPAPPDPEFDRIREIVAAAIDQHGQRQVARELGLSPSGVTKMLAGARPYARTRRVYATWARQRATEQPPLTGEEAHAAVALLVRDFSPEVRTEWIARVLTALREGYASEGRPEPDWLRPEG